MNPIEILIKNLDALIAAMKNQSTKNAYKALCDIEEIRSMPFNTFKTYANAVVRTALHVIDAAKPAETEIETVTTTKPEETEIETVTSSKPAEIPRKYKDWYVARCSDGYIRMNRTNESNGKQESVYVGKVWDAQEVERKLNPNQIDLLCPPAAPLTEPIPQKIVIDTSEPPRKYKDWNVARCGDGHIRMNKPGRNGKRISVYIGRYWSEEIAEAKLAKYAL